ncbi:MAG: energy-coupling factor ABC transporter substrate-binding protein [Desulfuromonadales bacterium]|nr:energy-coupling factor ABC transporter substrate-binding protein [Desulfuromonadales bacterium]
MSGALKNSLLWGTVVLLTFIPLLTIKAPGGGTDNQAQGVIEKLAPDYQPWFESLFTPDGASESLLFALQAALGAGVIGYYVGSVRKKRAATPPANVRNRAH